MSYILTLVESDKSHELTEKHFDKVISICAKHGAQTISDKVTWFDENKAGQISLSADTSMGLIKELRKILAEDKIDFFILDEAFKPGLLVADMESTIIPNEMLDDLAELFGIEDKIKDITERSMKGEIDFSESVRERVFLLKGTTEETLQEQRDSITPNPGAQEFVRTLAKDNVTTALVTGGFTYFSERIAKVCGFDHHHANVLDIKDGMLSGKVEDPILDKEAKAFFMNQYLDALDLGTENAIAIGDGANDLAMLTQAGLGIGYHPKPIVRDTIKNCVIHGDLTAPLYAMGYTIDMSIQPKPKAV